MKELLTANETKPKSIIIDGELHNHFKLFCKGKSMKIGGVIEDLIRLYLREPKETQRKIDEIKEQESIKEFHAQAIEALKR
jgi:hypothetical protein